MNINSDSEARRESARQADGKFGVQEHVEPSDGMNTLPATTAAARQCPDCGGDGGVEAHGGLIVCMTCEGDGTLSPVREAALDAVGGPRKMSIAKSALWDTALRADAPVLYSEEHHLCHPKHTPGLTAADVDPRDPNAPTAYGAGARFSGETDLERAIGTALDSIEIDQRITSPEACHGYIVINKGYQGVFGVYRAAKQAEGGLLPPSDLPPGPIEAFVAPDGTVTRFGAGAMVAQQAENCGAEVVLTPAGIDPESQAKVAADFEAWVADNADEVKTFTQTVADPDGGDPLECLAHNWWMERNGHWAGFADRLADDPAYEDAVRKADDRRRALIDVVGAVRDNNARAKAGIIGAESDLVHADYELEKVTGGHVVLEDGEWASYDRENQEVTTWATKAGAQRYLAEAALERITPLNILRENANRLRADADRAGVAYRQSTFDGNAGPSSTHSGAWDKFQTADQAVRRAEALTALANATTVSAYSLSVGDDGMVHID